MTQFPFLSPDESRDLAEHIRDLFDEVATTVAQEQRAYTGDVQPALDVAETDEAVVVVVDVSGVPATALRVLYRRGVLVVAGEKAGTAVSPDRTFHLMEREFGRFARAVQVPGALDVPNARATLASGELRIVLPKRLERRGQPHRIPVLGASSAGDAG